MLHSGVKVFGRLHYMYDYGKLVVKTDFGPAAGTSWIVVKSLSKHLLRINTDWLVVDGINGEWWECENALSLPLKYIYFMKNMHGAWCMVGNRYTFVYLKLIHLERHQLCLRVNFNSLLVLGACWRVDLRRKFWQFWGTIVFGRSSLIWIEMNLLSVGMDSWNGGISFHAYTNARLACFLDSF